MPRKKISTEILSKTPASKHISRKHTFPTSNDHKKLITIRKLAPIRNFLNKLMITYDATQPIRNTNTLSKSYACHTKPGDNLAMLPCPQVEANSLKMQARSQKCIPQYKKDNCKSGGSGLLLNNVLKTVTPPTLPTDGINVDSLPNSVDAELEGLAEISPKNLTESVNEILCQLPLNQQRILNYVEDTEVPSTTGPLVTSKINNLAGKLKDFFRGLLDEIIIDLKNNDNSEMTIRHLKYEIEQLLHKHSIELSDIRKKFSVILKDIQGCILKYRTKIINKTKTNCERETVNRVEETKSKHYFKSNQNLNTTTPARLSG